MLCIPASKRSLSSRALGTCLAKPRSLLRALDFIAEVNGTYNGLTPILCSLPRVLKAIYRKGSRVFTTRKAGVRELLTQMTAGVLPSVLPGG